MTTKAVVTKILGKWDGEYWCDEVFRRNGYGGWWFCGSEMAAHFDDLDRSKRYRLHFSKEPHPSGESVEIRDEEDLSLITNLDREVGGKSSVNTAHRALGRPAVFWATLEEVE